MRDRRSLVRIRDRRPSEWNDNSYSHRLVRGKDSRNHRSVSPHDREKSPRLAGGEHKSVNPRERERSKRFIRGDRQSLSPRERSRRLIAEERHNGSTDRRDYGSIYTDHKKDIRIESRTSTFDQPMNQSWLEEDCPRQSSTLKLQRKCLMSEGMELNRETKPIFKYTNGDAKSSGVYKDKSFYSNDSSVDRHEVQVQNSMYLEDRNTGTSFLPPKSDYLPSNDPKTSRLSQYFPLEFPHLTIDKQKDAQSHGQGYLEKFSQMGNQQEFFKKDQYSRGTMYSSSTSRNFGSTSLAHMPGDQDDLYFSSDGYNHGTSKFDTFRMNGHEQEPLNLFSYQRDLGDVNTYRSNQFRTSGDQSNFGSTKFGQRERSYMGFSSDELYKKEKKNDRAEFVSRGEPLRLHFSNNYGTHSENIVLSHSSPTKGHLNVSDRGLWNYPLEQSVSNQNHHDINREPLIRDRHGEFIASRHESARASQDHHLVHAGHSIFERDVGPLKYRERLISSPTSEFDIDQHPLNMSPSRKLNSKEPTFVYDAYEGVSKRRYSVDENRAASYEKNPLLYKKNVHDQEINGNNEFFCGDQIGFSPFKKLGFERTPNKEQGMKPFSSHVSHKSLETWLENASICDQKSSFEASSTGNRDGSIRDRLRFGPSKRYYTSFEKKFASGKPNKFLKKSLEKQHDESKTIVENTVVNNSNVRHLVKSNPPENSEEFKQMVHRSFLRYYKQLNESLSLRNKYLEQGKAGKVRCSACGSLSMEFLDTHSLVMHAFNSLKVGLKVDHLGLHKAICILMGWRSDVPPDNLRVYQSLPISEASIIKEDLILWPPLVVIHSTLMGNINEERALSIEDLGKIIRETGFCEGKINLCNGKGTDKSIFLVKFAPTFSGLQEAERFHSYLAENNQGRKAFLQMIARVSDSGHEITHEQSKQFYGYMGICEDLDKVDSETRKRCVVKSKKEIQAIADAPI